ncbi:hypothetical protein J116_025680 [Streptomyces thermolilacinus SPC6]|uniref:Uncharacterized protein n=1 Tax=Streptomyces thermolilacinus SPC6 TaxID=1306406 RepID=A0A1D3DYD4_9ACTN|nr:hypothetical protein J116_025680 [Streptomyces thermolilacinus SPC6]
MLGAVAGSARSAGVAVAVLPRGPRAGACCSSQLPWGLPSQRLADTDEDNPDREVRPSFLG